MSFYGRQPGCQPFHRDAKKVEASPDLNQLGFEHNAKLSRFTILVDI